MNKTTCLTFILLVCVFICGCQKGSTDEELINTTMNNWKQAMSAQDIDAIMANYSEKFSSQEAEDKEEMRKGLQEAITMGMLENIDINLETAELTITDDTAEISIIDDNGELEMAFTLRKEDKNIWRIIGIPSETCSYERYASLYGDDCVEHEGFYRCWDIYVPEGLTGNVTLVIDLHGWTENPSRQRAISGFDSLADSEGFIVVWPYGLCNSWNSGAACCPPASEDNIDDVGFIRKLIEKVSAQYDIDSKRIYVTGLSNGCSMAQRLANEASDIIAACACISLHLLVPEDPEYNPVSVMTILGTNDDLYEPGDTPGALENFNTWKTMNNCTGSYTVTWSSGDSVAWTYQDCENGTEVCLVTIDGGGHVLYKGIQTDIDTSRLAWDFMKRFTKLGKVIFE
jgi:polyhydroxybutyrate depolymerase